MPRNYKLRKCKWGNKVARKDKLTYIYEWQGDFCQEWERIRSLNINLENITNI